MEYRTVSTRLSVDEFTLVADYCKRKNASPSSLIKELLFEEIAPSIPANVAGRNVFEYDKKKDSFSWVVELDSGDRITVLKNVSPEYMTELSSVVSTALTSRNELQGKKKKTSVPIPRKIMKERKI